MSGGRSVGWSVGWLGGWVSYGTVLAILALVLVLFCTLFWPCPALAWPCNGPVTPPYMHSSNLVGCASLGHTLPPCTPGTPTTSRRARVYPCTAEHRGRHVWRARGAHSWLHPWQDSLSMSPGPIPLARHPADRHPHVTTLCHPSSAHYGSLWPFSTN